MARVDGPGQAHLHPGGSAQMAGVAGKMKTSFHMTSHSLAGFVWACSCGGGRVPAAGRASPLHAHTLLMITFLWSKQVTQPIPDLRGGKMDSVS